MRWGGAFVLAVVAALAPLAASADGPLKGVALVIGEEDYDSVQTLSNPINDAKAMRAMLNGMGFDTTTALDADRDALKVKIGSFLGKAAHADVALVYYSGHGVELGGEDYLLPVDADVSTPQAAGASLIDVSELLTELQKVTKVSIILLDACRTSPFAAGTMIEVPDKGEAAPPTTMAAGAKGTMPVALAETAPDSLGMVIGFAASPGQTAADDDEGSGHSPYAAALLKHFGAAGYSIGDLMTMVTQEVYLRTKARQIPWTNSSLRTTLTFAAAPGPDDPNEASIAKGRRDLLLNIATLPEATRSSAERVASANGVPLDAVYGLLKQLGIEPPGNQDLETSLQQGAERIKQLLADARHLDSNDPRLLQLQKYANDARDEGLMDQYEKYWDEAVDLVNSYKQSLDAQTEAVRAGHLLAAGVYASDAAAASVNRDFAKAAKLYGAAVDDARQWDADAAFKYQWAEANALKDQGDWGNDNAPLTAAIQSYGDAAKLISAQTRPADWAALHTDLGDAMNILGFRAGDNGMLQEAAGVLNEAATTLARLHAPMLWARAEFNLAVAEYRLGDRIRGMDTLLQAIAHFHASLAVWNRWSAPLEWGRTQSLLGATLHVIAWNDRNADLERQAIAADAEAQKERTRGRVPLLWAATQSNLADHYYDLYRIEGQRDDLTSSIAAARLALDVLTSTNDPTTWGYTQEHLARALSALGRDEGDAAVLEQALGAYRTAQQGTPLESSPIDWIRVQTNIAESQRLIGVLTEDPKRIREAIATAAIAADNAARIADVTDEAFAHDRLGAAQWNLGQLAGNFSLLARARASMLAARELYHSAAINDYDDYFSGQIDNITQDMRSLRPLRRLGRKLQVTGIGR